MTIDSAARDVWELHVARAPAALRVHSFRGRERLSRPYEFVVRVHTELDEAALVDLLGSTACLVMEPGEHRRLVHGIVRRVTLDSDDSGAGRDLLAGTGLRGARLWLAPGLSLLGQGRHSRIFQDVTVRAIVDAILGEAELALRWRLLRAERTRGYCVQHRESDLAFVTRLLAEEGMFYWFESPPEVDGRETLGVADHASLYVPVAGPPTIAYRADSGTSGSNEHVRDLEMSGRVRPASTLLRQYDYEHPRRRPEGRAGARPGERALRVYEHGSEHRDQLYDDTVAETHLEQHGAGARTYRGRSRSIRLAPGRVVRLEGHKDPSFDAAYAVVAIDHRGTCPETQAGAAPREVYDNHFELVPADVARRPRRPPRRIQQVLETAAVVGPPGHEIHTDVLGRVKVQFHWNLEERASCWLRVMQPWAGAGWGTQFIPRVGMEVLVSFVQGDTDSPIVLGSVYNGDHPLPFPPGSSKTKSGIRTQSSRGGQGANELSFEDRAGREKIYVGAQRDLEEAVGHDHRTTVGNDQHVRVQRTQVDEVGGSRFVLVADAHATSVGGQRSATVAHQSVEKIGRARTVEVGHDDDLVVRGSSSLRTAGNVETHVGGIATRRVGGADLTYVMGVQTVTVGDRAHPSAVDEFAWGSRALGASEHLTLQGHQGITLRCGDSAIELRPDSIRLVAPSVAVLGAEKLRVAGNGAALELDGKARVFGAEVKLLARGAGAVFDTDARIAGAGVHLGGSLTPPPPVASDEAVPTQPLHLRLTDYRFRPYARKHYELTVDGVVHVGTTTAEGHLDQQVPKTARLGELVLYIDDYPRGRRRRYSIRIGELPEATTPRGAQMRLHHLGYYKGAYRDDAHPAMTRALRDFQRDHHLAATGALDARTAARLREVHGH